MDNLAPSYQFLINLRLNLENGYSLRTSIQQELENHSGPFYEEVKRWFVSEIQGHAMSPAIVTKNIYRQSLFHVLALGLRGVPIHATLKELEKEWERAVNDDVERHLQRLPVLVLLPLVFLQFPAFLALLLGPLILDLTTRLSN